MSIHCGYSLVSLMLQDRPQKAVEAAEENTEDASQPTGTNTMAYTLKGHLE